MYEGLYKHLFSRVDPEQIHQLSLKLLASAGQFSSTRSFRGHSGDRKSKVVGSAPAGAPAAKRG